MDPAGEDDTQLAGIADVGFEQHVDRALPERETGTRAHVATAFPPLEDEPSRPLLDEAGQQARVEIKILLLIVYFEDCHVFLSPASLRNSST